MNTIGDRPSILIGHADQRRILDALRLWCASGDFVALRTRAFVHLLWDGALTPKGALSLNLRDVLVLEAGRNRVRTEIEQAPCEANRYRGRRCGMRARTRDALRAYVEYGWAVGWITEGLKAPLFVSTASALPPQRLSIPKAKLVWRAFQQDYARPSRIYEMRDVVYTGRLAFLRAAGGRVEVLRQHMGRTPTFLESRRDLHSDRCRPGDVLEALDLGCQLSAKTSGTVKIGFEAEENNRCV